MITPTLEGVYVKLARARFHARDLIARTSALVEDDGSVFRREFDGDPSKYVYWIDRIPVIEPDLSAIVGDFLTNMRAALDHLYFQLPLLENRCGSENDNFPIRFREPTGDSGNPRPLSTNGITDQRVRDALIAVQPYSHPGPATNGLHILNTLVNTDKHRLLLVVVAALEFDGIQWMVSDGAKDPGHWLNVNPLRDGDQVARFDFWGVGADPEFDPHLELQTRLADNVLASDVNLRILSLEKLLGFLYNWVESQVLDRYFLTFFDQSARVGSGRIES